MRRRVSLFDYPPRRLTSVSLAARKLLKSLSVKQGLKYDSEESAAEIPAFILFHRLNVDGQQSLSRSHLFDASF